MKKFDVILVLGSGISKSGKLYPDSIVRLKKGIGLFQNGISNCLAFSGNYSFSLDFKPVKGEATAMKEFAVKDGIPASRILVEPNAHDSLSNLVFSKRLFLKKKFKSVAIVTSLFHVPRARFCAKMVFGNKLKFSVIPVHRLLSADEKKNRVKHEKDTLNYLKKAFKGISPGNDQAIESISYSYVEGFKHGRIQKGETFEPKKI